jgi:hypothetical protein
MANAGCGCAALAADALFDDEVPGDLAVQGLHLEHQVLALSCCWNAGLLRLALAINSPMAQRRKRNFITRLDEK